MAQNKHEPANAVQASSTPDQDQTLTEAILNAIEDCKKENLQRSDFILYEDIDPDALNSLFRHDARPRTTVTFRTDGVEVELWGDDGIEIRVTDRLPE